MTPLTIRMTIPTPAHGHIEDIGREQQESDIHRKNVEQRRTVDQEQGSDDRGERMGEIKIQQVVDRGSMSVCSECRHDGKHHGEHDQVVAIDPERSLPEFAAYPIAVFPSLVDVKRGHQHGRQKYKALGRGNKSERLVDQVAEMSRQVSQRHPNQEKSAQGVQLRTALYLSQQEYFP